MKITSGFTIVELLIVIAIIGILVAVILGSLSSARDDGLAAKVKSEMAVLLKRSSVDESQSLTYDVVCGSNGFATSTAVMSIIASIERFSPEKVTCHSQTSKFAASAATGSSTYWCIDSTGVSKEATAQLTAGEYQCP